MTYRYLDATVAELIERNEDVCFYCRCARHVTLGPEDFARWPNSTLHRIAARLRCTGCNSLGDIPEVRISAVRARSGGRDAGAGAHCPMIETHGRPCVYQKLDSTDLTADGIGSL